MSTRIGSGGKRRTTHALVVDEIRQRILDGILQPGDRIRLQGLAQELGVSITPVREALHQLVAEGTVTLDPYRGSAIAELSAKEAEDLYTTRAALEALATRLAVPRLREEHLTQMRRALCDMERARASGDRAAFVHANRALNRALYSTTERPILTRQVFALMDSSVRYQHARVLLPGAMDATLAAHRAMLEVCEQRDAVLAEQLVRQRLEVAAVRVIESLPDRAAPETELTAAAAIT